MAAKRALVLARRTQSTWRKTPAGSAIHKSQDRAATNAAYALRCAPLFRTPSTSGRWPAPRVFGAFHTTAEVRADSSSGGVFSLFAEKRILAWGGVLAGALLDDNLEVRHSVVTEAAGVGRTARFEIPTSHTGPVFRQLRQAMAQGRPALFVGTPCQVAGLYGFLRKDHDPLITVDLVCHGVPSRRFFEKYIRHHEGDSGDKVVSVNFQTKRSGWKDFGVALQLKSGRGIVTPFEHDWFMRGFLQNLVASTFLLPLPIQSRPSRRRHHRFGDFWGIGEVDAQLDDGNGCSLVLVNGEKGGRLFDGVRARLVAREQVRRRASTESSRRVVRRDSPDGAVLQESRVESVRACSKELPWRALEFSSPAIGNPTHARTTPG